MKYAFWNNKGGTGKSSLAFQTIASYAIANPNKRILAVDLCPQSNLSELFMGGLVHNGGINLSSLYSTTISRSIGGFFQLKLSNPYNTPAFNPSDYLVSPSLFNSQIPSNIDLLAGDRIVELQSNSISALSLTQIPGVDSYLKIADWLNEFIQVAVSEKGYDDVFIDTNPSFSIYTQIALAAAERLILPVMADDSSRRALQNVFSLVYGVNLPSPIYNDYSFTTKLINAGRVLPKVHLIVKNRLTQYMGTASAYHSVLLAIDNDLSALLATNPQYFTFTNLSDGIVNVRDFQTTGVVAFAEAAPFSTLSVGTHTIFGNETRIKNDNLQNCISAIDGIRDKI